MKKSLTRKLFLSVAALTATAATLSTSTFAWYTANTEAKVNEVKASTESKGSDSLFISAAQTYDGSVAQTWGGYLAEVDPKLTGGTATQLKPVFSNYADADITAATTGTESTEAVKGRSYNEIGETTAQYSYAITADTDIVANKKYYTLSGENTYTEVASPVKADIATYYDQTRIADKVAYKDEDTKNFVEFVIRVKSGQVLQTAKPLYFSEFNLTSAQTNANQIALATGEGTGISTAGAYGADLLKALKLDITSAPVTLNSGSVIPDTAVTTRLAGETEQNAVSTYGFESLGKNDTNIGTANAVGYYNTVMARNVEAPNTYAAGTETTKLETASSSDALVVAELPKTADGMDFSVVEIRFVLYLDGWDNYCYDIMQNQSFKLTFKLTTDSAKSVLQDK